MYDFETQKNFSIMILKQQSQFDIFDFTKMENSSPVKKANITK